MYLTGWHEDSEGSPLLELVLYPAPGAPRDGPEGGEPCVYLKVV